MLSWPCSSLICLMGDIHPVNSDFWSMWRLHGLSKRSHPWQSHCICCLSMLATNQCNFPTSSCSACSSATTPTGKPACFVTKLCWQKICRSIVIFVVVRRHRSGTDTASKTIGNIISMQLQGEAPSGYQMGEWQVCEYVLSNSNSACGVLTRRSSGSAWKCINARL